MKHFEEWFKQSGYCQDNEEVKIALLDAWDAAVNPEDPITVKIKELLTTINDAEKIDCTCKNLKYGLKCVCQRGGALQQAGKELGDYLKKLRKGLK